MTGPVDGPAPHRPDAAYGDRPLRDTLAWVLQSLEQPASAAGDWIAYEVDPARATTAALLCDPATPVSRLRRARILYAALRADGDTAGERTLGSRLAVACAAAAYLFHGERLTNHDDAALLASFRSTASDDGLDPKVREMVNAAERRLAHEMG